MASQGDPTFGKLQIEWRAWKDFQRALRKAADDELPKRIGQANRKTGEFIKRLVDRQSDPAAVGAGRGAAVRPSSSRREVLLRVGGSHRDVGTLDDIRKQSWGRVRGRRPQESAPPRPHIRQIVEDNRDRIEQEWLTQIEKAMSPAFADTDF